MSASKRQLHIGRSGVTAFKIPVAFMTETAAILARRGAGKTHTAMVMAEELLAASQQIVAIDPLNAWWGLRSGYKVVIFGGPKGDLPLEPQSGRVIADAVAENPSLSCVLSLRHMRKAKQKRFVYEFADQLFHRKGEDDLATAVHVFIDEAHRFAPQFVRGDDANMVGAVSDLVLGGRQAGIGVTLITQRSAKLNKDVLTQAEILIAGQITGPQDKKAVREWIEDNADIDEQKAFIKSLATLKRGELWVWSPSFLKCLSKVNIRKKRTFDSSATPKAGAKSRRPKMRAKPLDLEALRSTLAETIKQAEEKDPKALRRKVLLLEKELAAKVKPQGRAATVVQGRSDAEVNRLVQRAVHDRDTQWRAELVRSCTPLTEAIATQRSDIERGNKAVAAVVRDLRKMKGPTDAVTVPTSPKPLAPAPVHPRPAPRSPTSADSSNGLGRCERALLTVLAQRGRICTRRLVALQAGYSINSGGFKNSISSLRTKGFIEGSIDLAGTEAGLDALGEYDPLPTGKDLIAHWTGRLKPKAVRKVFECVAAAYPDDVTTDEVAERTGYSPTSGGFKNALSALRTLELITGKSLVALSDEIYEG